MCKNIQYFHSCQWMNLTNLLSQMFSVLRCGDYLEFDVYEVTKTKTNIVVVAKYVFYIFMIIPQLKHKFSRKVFVNET